MSKQSIQKLRDSQITLNDEVIESALETSYTTYQHFVCKLHPLDIQLVWNYYTDGKAWLAKGLYAWTGVRGGKKEMTVFWLSIWDGFFKVTVYLPETYRKDALNLPLDHKTLEMIQNAKVMGKTFKTLPLTFNVHSDNQLDSLFLLIQLKLDTK